MIPMADILPFPAIRPAPDKAPYVVSRSYESYSKSQRDYEMQHNPFSFLHVLNPGFKFHQELKGSQRFQGVRNRYLEFLEEGILMREAVPAYYLYESRSVQHASYGVFCATSTEDYRGGVIRRHEDTLRHREVLFADYLEAVRFNAEPVLMTYPHDPLTEELLTALMKDPPVYHFTTPDMIMHKMWVVSGPQEVKALQEAFRRIPALYIADGHHRSASSDLLANRLKGCQDSGAMGPGYFMSYLIDESQLKIGAFSRLVSDLNGLDPEQLLLRLDSAFRIHEKGALVYEPEEKHAFGMYLDGAFYALYLRDSVHSLDDPLSRLDSHILYRTVLEPIFGISDLRMDSRIAYRSSPQPGLDIRDEVDSGRAAVGFTMQPVTLEEIRQVADAGQTMPPKTTYVEPKLRSGLTIYEIRQDDEHSRTT